MGSTTSIIQIDPGKCLREMVAKYDMDGTHPSPIPISTGTKVYMNEGWDGDEDL